MPDRSYKLIQLVGTSEDDLEGAINNALDKAGESLHGMAWFEVKEMRGRVEGKQVGEWQVKLDVAFKLD